MTIFRFDRTLDGLLTAVFDAYARRSFPDVLQGDEVPLPLFYEEEHTVITDEAKATRVWNALRKKLSHQALSCLATARGNFFAPADKVLF